MPFIDLETSGGPFSFRYSIATPTSRSADRVVPDLPCILFLHSGYVAQEIFEFQYADRNLRQFNLIAIDMRGNGETKGMIAPDTRFTPTESAIDVEQILTKLNIPPCHIFGLSNGCTVALEFAVANPTRVLSLTLCSPLPPVEPEETAAGRLEVYRYWELSDNSMKANGSSREPLDQEMVVEVMTGATQLIFNISKTDSVQAMADFGLATATRIWAGSAENLKQCYKATIEWFLQRRALSPEMFKKITVPVTIIHCNDDIGYPFHYAQDLEKKLKEAGVSEVSLRQVAGAHYGNVTNPEPINRILYSAVLSCHPNFLPNKSLASGDGSRERLLTPFTETLMKFGYDPESD
ncbi:Alpha/Beta hydrolase protein [Flammula alnicola]|nr:Alpha/Beta hydrolase protein [Flammula alnicola]